MCRYSYCTFFSAGLSSDELLRVELNIVPAEKCNSSYFPKSSLKQLELGITPESMICVGSAGGVKNTCLVHMIYLSY